jgi:aminoglycoside phosphotransferase (APT) family kinase protein
MDGSDVRNEFPALRYAHARGVPVAEALWLEDDPAILGGRFIVSRMASGRNYGDVFGSGTALDEATIRELVRVLATLHRTPLDHDDPAFRASHLSKWARYRTVREFAGPYVEYWAGIAEKCLVSSPAIARGFAWLRANLPQDETPTVMAHGDYGLHNVMIEDGKVAAILDWEASYVGDPADEFFLFAIVMSPFVDPATLIQWYLEAGGQPISEFRLRFFAVLGCLKGPIVGYGSLNLSEHHPEADIKICLVGLKYVALQLNALNDAIAAAEAARDAQR